MNKTAIACHTGNYGGLRSGKPKYIVIHYTGGKGDTAENNGEYFANNAGLNASAHWFVDEREAVASVQERFVAWHCGGKVYTHPECRNSNSIGVELCSDWDGKDYLLTDKTLANAVELVREIMARYDIPVENVIRHYDVTGKVCPAPMVGEHKDQWEKFKEAILMYQPRYDTLDQVPSWAQETVKKLMDRGVLQGNGQGLDLSQDMVRIMVLLDRAGAFD